MAKCDVCGNDYARAFEIMSGGRKHTFDSFECAISRLAPLCAHCQCRIIGHGLEADSKIFCCAHCARNAGINSLRDHA